MNKFEKFENVVFVGGGLVGMGGGGGISLFAKSAQNVLIMGIDRLVSRFGNDLSHFQQVLSSSV